VGAEVEKEEERSLRNFFEQKEAEKEAEGPKSAPGELDGHFDKFVSSKSSNFKLARQQTPQLGV